MRLLWLTNDLPPQAGGIQQFVANLVRRTAPKTSVVIGPSHPQAAAHDRLQPYRVVRAPGRVLPTPGILRLSRRVALAHRPDAVVLGASWPLGELAPALARDPGVPVVALTHGLEAGMASLGLGWLVTRATRGCAAVTTISAFTERRLRGHLKAPLVARVPPGVDVDAFLPRAGGHLFREHWGIPASAPLVGCVSRLVRRKGQDVLLEAWPRVVRRHHDAWLALVGGGPMEAALRRTAGKAPRVVMTGELPWEDLPGAYSALDVFAMPCRSRFGGLDVEGLGVVYLEAQASGVPVIAGNSGGAPETVIPQETGLVVDGRSAAAVADAVARLLDSPGDRDRMGRRARAWMLEEWAWPAVVERFQRLLTEVTGG